MLLFSSKNYNKVKPVNNGTRGTGYKWPYIQITAIHRSTITWKVISGPTKRGCYRQVAVIRTVTVIDKFNCINNNIFY